MEMAVNLESPFPARQRSGYKDMSGKFVTVTTVQNRLTLMRTYQTNPNMRYQTEDETLR